MPNVILDTGFLISLISKDRPEHEVAKAYYKYFTHNDFMMLVPTIVVSEFCVKQPFSDLPLHNFTILPFNYGDAVVCGALNSFYYREKLKAGQRDAVKDDFKIIAQAKEQDAAYLITEDASSMKPYCEALKKAGKIRFDVIPLSEGFDVSFVNGNGQREISYPPGDGSSSLGKEL
jgi:hypothetical protein